jgi:hypothetical protein
LNEQIKNEIAQHTDDVLLKNEEIDTLKEEIEKKDQLIDVL